MDNLRGKSYYNYILLVISIICAPIIIYFSIIEYYIANILLIICLSITLGDYQWTINKKAYQKVNNYIQMLSNKDLYTNYQVTFSVVQTSRPTLQRVVIIFDNKKMFLFPIDTNFSKDKAIKEISLNYNDIKSSYISGTSKQFTLDLSFHDNKLNLLPLTFNQKKLHLFTNKFERNENACENLYKYLKNYSQTV